MSDADTLANNLPGKKQKTHDGWMACCPAHDDRNPSLSISETSDAKVLVHCHRGCDQETVISVLRARGLWPEKGTRLRLRPVSHRDLERQVVEADTKRSAAALAIWRSAGPAQGTQVETYLGSRGLVLPPLPNLCFHPDLKHPSGGFWPAMVALVTRGSDEFAEQLGSFQKEVSDGAAIFALQDEVARAVVQKLAPRASVAPAAVLEHGLPVHLSPAEDQNALSDLLNRAFGFVVFLL